MPEYKLTFVVEGQDKGASGVLGKVAGGLGGIAQFAIGDLLAGGIRQIGSAVAEFGRQALESVGHAQGLEMAMEGLLTESLMYQKVTDVTQVAMSLTGAESKKLQNALRQQASLTATIGKQEVALAEASQKKNESDAAYQARLEKMRTTLEVNRDRLAEYTSLISSLNSKEGSLVDVTTRSWQTTMDYGQANALAKEQVADLLSFVEELAIVSPFETRQVEEVTRIGLSAGLSAEKVQDFTQAFLDYSAVHGITSSNLAFAADQFLQLRKAGTLSAIDLRQLRRLGIDVERILGVKMAMGVEEFNAQVKNSPELMDQLFDSFIEMSGEGTAGAAQRMALTIDGMMSTANDIIEVGSKKLFRPLVDAVSPFLADLIGQISSFATGGQLEAIGAQVGAFITEKVVPVLTDLWTWLQEKLPQAIDALKGFWTDTLQPAIERVAEIWTGTLQPAFERMVALWQEYVQPIIAQVAASLREDMTPVWAGLGAILAVVVVPAVVSLVAGLVAALAPIVAIGLAVGLLVAAWQNDWGGIRTTLTEVWEGTIQPALETLWEWLKVKVPAALEILREFWEQRLWPALKIIWGWIDENLIPLFRDIAKLVGVTLALALEVLTGLWQNVLLPALTEVWSFISEKVLPILADLWRWLTEKVTPAFDAIAGVIKNVRDGIQQLIDKLANAHLPDWLTPGSPTPFELGLRGIAQALDEVNARAGGPLIGTYGTSGAGAGGPQYHLHIQSSAPTEPIVSDFRMMEAMAGA